MSASSFPAPPTLIEARFYYRGSRQSTSAADMDATDGRALAWTEEAKFQFLLRIVAQLKEDGRTIKWEKINMPGRTTKSLQNMWTKINKAVCDIEKAQGNGDDAGTPTKTPSKRKKATPRSARAKKSQPMVYDEDVDDEYGLEQETPSKKRTHEGIDASNGAKKMKTEAELEDFAQCLKKEDDTEVLTSVEY